MRVGKSGQGEIEPGELIAHQFRIAETLGRGRAGIVYRVLERRTGEALALKRLRDPDPSALLAFQREYDTLKHISHPNVVQVRDWGHDRGAPFYTMELLEGSDLRAAVPMPWQRACSILRDIASALAILHSRRLLHRDLSTRNVMCTPDGRARLLDFGSLRPMGPSKRVVGTPPFVAPEALQQWTLDGRTDLYALGVLGYRLLTGELPFPAQSLDALWRAWEAPPTHLVTPEPIPAQLQVLILELLHLDRTARPAAAAEVIERLCGIAQLPAVTHATTTRAYLTLPSLVGRERQLATLERSLGSGGDVMIEGEPGMGRTRLLEVGTLKARQRGHVVLHVDGLDPQQPYAGVLRLRDQLRAALPEYTESARDRELWRSIADGEPRGSKRAGAQDALRHWLLQHARHLPLVIAADGIDSLDEPSRALLAALGEAEEPHRPRLLLSASTASPATPGSALEVLRARGTRIELTPLGAEETEDLLRSVFGDVAHVTGAAATIHALAEGNPRSTMALAEHLVESGAARYGAGSWALPPSIEEARLPNTLRSAWRARIDGLSEDARELASALALTRCDLVDPADYARLTGHGDRLRTHAALDDLLAAAVLVWTEGGYRFAHPGYASVLSERATDAIALHSRIADVVRHNRDAVLWPHHLLSSAKPRAAIKRLLELRDNPDVPFSSRLLTVLERAVDAAAVAGAPPEDELRLHVWLLEAAAQLGRDQVFRARAVPLLAQLEVDSGYRDLVTGASGGSRPEDLGLALSQAQARFEAASPAERRYPPALAIEQLGRLCGITASMAGVVQDVTLLEGLPRLSLLGSLSPALAVVDDVVQNTMTFQRGRFEAAARGWERILERLEEPDRAGFDDLQWKAVRLGGLYTLGVLAAANGQRITASLLEELEDEPGHRVNAWRVRMSVALIHGDADAALLCRHRAERCHLQDGGVLPYPGSTGRLELLAHVYCQDIVGVKRSMESIARTAQLYPRWRPTLAFARAHYLHLRGEHHAAVTELEHALEQLEPTRNLDWAIAAASLPIMLSAAGRHEEAIERGLADLDTCLREDLSPSHRGLLRTVGDAMVCAGRPAEAVPLLERCIEESIEVGTCGMQLGLAHESRARAALALGDHRGFVESATRCAQEYGRGRNQALRGRFEQLVRDATRAGIDMPAALTTAAHTTPPAIPRAALLEALQGAGPASDEVYWMQRTPG